MLKKIMRITGGFLIALILAAILLPGAIPVSAAADHYFVMGQCFLTDGTTTTDKAGRNVADTDVSRVVW